jgi:hypothetical protein
VEEAHVEERENGRYFVYEHLSQVSREGAQGELSVCL